MFRICIQNCNANATTFITPYLMLQRIWGQANHYERPSKVCMNSTTHKSHKSYVITFFYLPFIHWAKSANSLFTEQAVKHLVLWDLFPPFSHQGSLCFFHRRSTQVSQLINDCIYKWRQS